MKLYVVNVGVNTADARKHQLRSPIFPDGTFEFVPIRESDRFSGVATIPRYCDLPSWTGEACSLAHFLPVQQRQALAHHDPDFGCFTYGDIQSSRAAALKDAMPGDQLWFLARLWKHDRTCFLETSGFFFIGFFVVEVNLLFDHGSAEYPPELLPRLKSNAHWHRREAGDRGTFRVLLGHPDKSRRFQKAIAVTPSLAAHLFASSYDAQTERFICGGHVSENKNGNPRLWRHFGSITRAVQWFLDSNDSNHKAHLEVLDSLARDAGSVTLSMA